MINSFCNQQSQSPISSAAGIFRTRFRGLEPRKPVSQRAIQRCWTATELAERAGIAGETLRRVESGAPGMSLGSYLAALWALGVADRLDSLAQHSTGLESTDARLGQRVRRGWAAVVDKPTTMNRYSLP